MEQFRSEIARFSRDPIVRICAVINNLVFGLEPDLDVTAHALFALQIAGPRSQYLQTIRRLYPSRLILHRHQLLLVAKEALLNCPEQGKLPSPGDDLLRIFLMASDHTNYKTSNRTDSIAERSKDDDEVVRLIGEFFLSLQASRFNSYLPRLVRPLLILSHICEPSDPFDLSALFERATGLSLKQYFSLVFATGPAKATQHSVEAFAQNPDVLGVQKAWFVGSKITESQAQAFLRDVSLTPVEFADFASTLSKGPNDFTVFKERPMIQLGDRYYAIDLYFLAEKNEASLFWRINDSLGKVEREKFHSFWGYLFQRYVDWVMNQSVDGRRNQFVSTVHYQDEPNREVCDGLVICKDGVVLLEDKGGMFTAAAKYGGDVQKLKIEIEEKLVHPKGVAQLARAVINLFGPEARRVRGLDLSLVPKVVPLLIVRDEAGGAFMLNAYLNKRFQQMIQGYRFSAIVTPLFCISADDFERVSGYLKDKALTEILEGRYRPDKELRSSFGLVENRALRDWRTRVPPVIRQGLDELKHLSNEILFGDPNFGDS